MALAPSIKAFLDGQGIGYETYCAEGSGSPSAVAKAAGADRTRLVRALLLHDASGPVVAVVPAASLVDFGALRRKLGRDLEPAPGRLAQERFPDCQPMSVPAVTAPYGIETILAEQVYGLDPVYFEAGRPGCLIRVSGEGFRALHAGSRTAAFTHPLARLREPDVQAFVDSGNPERGGWVRDLLPYREMDHRLQEARQRLPAIPTTLHHLLALRELPSTSGSDVTAVIERDPSVAGAVIRYARAPCFNYLGTVDSVSTAVEQVLGPGRAVDAALAFALSDRCQNPVKGPLGGYSFWRHVFYAALISRRLAREVPGKLGVDPHQAFVAGLLHDCGYMAMAQSLRPEFYLLNQILSANPDLPVPLVEQRVLGVSHTRMGGWLLEGWAVPEAVAVAAREHHNESYSGRHSGYAGLVLVVDHILRSLGDGDAVSTEAPRGMLRALGLEQAAVDRAVHEVMEQAECHDRVAHELAGE